MLKIRLLHYLILFTILVAGGFLFFRFRYFPNYQFLTVVGTVLAYWLWGAGHHAYHKRLTRHVMLEYILIGFVVILMFATVLNINV